MHKEWVVCYACDKIEKFQGITQKLSVSACCIRNKLWWFWLRALKILKEIMQVVLHRITLELSPPSAKISTKRIFYDYFKVRPDKLKITLRRAPHCPIVIFWSVFDKWFSMKMLWKCFLKCLFTQNSFWNKVKGVCGRQTSPKSTNILSLPL